MNSSMVDSSTALLPYQQVATDKILKSAANSAEPALVKRQAARGQLTDWAAVRAYIFAGKAIFTLHNPKTGVRLTYKVTAKKAEFTLAKSLAMQGLPKPENFVTYFVTLLRGPDNTTDFIYMGVLRKPGDFFITTKSQVTRHPVSYRALVWFLDAMRNEREILGGKPLEFWHSGCCGCCRRLLTVPDSVARGIGPECARRVG